MFRFFLASEIGAIYILKDYQRYGIGSALLDEALKRLPHPSVVLFVLEGNQKPLPFIKRKVFVSPAKNRSKGFRGELVEWEMALTREI